MKRTIFIFTCLFSMYTFGQEIEVTPVVAETTENTQESDSLEAYKVKRISAGLKIGVPNIAGLSLEGVTPLFDNRVALYADFSKFNVDDDESEVGLGYNEFGVNVYFGNKGKGLYAGIGAGNLSADLTFYEDLDGGGRGKGSTDLDIKSTNLKLGIKTGGRFYFRFEVGYGFTSDVPSEVTITLEEIGGSGRETETLEIPAIPGLGTSGLLVSNIGFGVSF